MTSLSSRKEEISAVITSSSDKQRESTFCLTTKQNHCADENFYKENAKKLLITDVAAVEIPADVNTTAIAGNFYLLLDLRNLDFQGGKNFSEYPSYGLG